MIPSYKSNVKLAQTDSLGRYSIDGIQFPDSSSFILKAKKGITLSDVEIIPDSDIFPKPTVYIPTPLKANVATVVQDEYFNQSKEKYFTEGGMRVVNLGEVTVKAAKKETNYYNSYYYPGTEDALITSEKLKQYPGQGVLQVLIMTMAGIHVVENQKREDGSIGPLFSIDGKLGDPNIMIDGMKIQDMNDLKYIILDEVESISLFRSDTTILITLKKWEDRKSQKPISLTKITPLGYQKPAEFYVPKYDVDSVRLSDKADLRTTIYWNPKLETDDNGNVHVSFYTADKSNNYSVVMEGISSIGEICRYVGMLKREDK